MKAVTIIMILVSVTLTASAQVALKFGMSARKFDTPGSFGDVLNIAFALASSPWIVFGLFLFGVSVVLWLFVLASVPLSIAYPFVALGICLTTVAGNILFHEPFTPLKVLGVTLIMAGIISISASYDRLQ